MVVTVKLRSLAWFSTGVAMTLVVMLVVVHAFRADAAAGDGDSTFVPVAPCRLFDYRPAPDTVGTRTSPLGPGEIATQQVTGSVGQCVGIPADAVAISMNVTITQPTAASFLTVFPADLTAPPTASNLNWLAGQVATPNKVDVKLSPGGAIKLFNAVGSVFVLADVVGYYTSSTLQELVAAQPFTVSESFATVVPLTTTVSPIESVSLTAPVGGHVTAFSQVGLDSTNLTQDASAACAIEREGQQAGGYGINTPNAQFASFLTEAVYRALTLSGTRTFEVAAGETITVVLYCQERIEDGPRVRTATLTAMFTPAP